ncbi:hypothetical protein TSUD_175810 [Trifolium subterraneum]|uniref:Transcription initiation factor TFIID subunit 10 n=1 Tax=Trifolium subterraneum TaxID=3900 RepID=A0A2Z6M059_TRISU|nr:hypothetical protein TSUD_175810 [Trifolium subterraneum]
MLAEPVTAPDLIRSGALQIATAAGLSAAQKDSAAVNWKVPTLSSNPLLKSPDKDIYLLLSSIIPFTMISGFQCPDVRLTTLVAVATQKFVAEVAGDALQYCKARQASIPKDKRDRQQKDRRLVLTMEDLSKALREYGVNLRHQEYFADNPSTGMDPATRDE